MGVLRFREFRLLFTGQLVSLLGDGIFTVALSFAVLDETGSEAGLGIVLAAGALPLVALVLVGGVWADRLSRRRVMLVADAARMAIQGLLAALVVLSQVPLWSFVVLYGLYGVAMAFFSPASTGLRRAGRLSAKIDQNGRLAERIRAADLFCRNTRELRSLLVRSGWKSALSDSGSAVRPAIT